jgi:hypothetical protein
MVAASHAGISSHRANHHQLWADRPVQEDFNSGEAIGKSATALKMGQEPQVDRTLRLIELAVAKAVDSLHQVAAEEKWPERRKEGTAQGDMVFRRPPYRDGKKRSEDCYCPR